MEELKSELRDSMNVFDFYKTFSPLIAKLKDGHTELFFPIETAITSNIEVFPYTVKINKTDTTVVIQKGIPDIEECQGMQILSINGVIVKELVSQACSMLSGEASHYKMERLSFFFSPLLYILFSSNQFSVECVDNGERKVKFIEGKPLSEYLEIFLSFNDQIVPYSFRI